MEQEPNPELPPLKDDCLHCDEAYYLTPENSVLNLFVNDPVCNYLETTCDHCGEKTHILLAGNETVKECKRRNIPIEVERFASTEQRQTYMDLSEMNLAETQDLTNRQERVAAFLVFLLQNDRMSAEDFEDGSGALFI